ncbi:hypothetical protein VTO42DRAFT_5865 [Malbranchea cinnamomea]
MPDISKSPATAHGAGGEEEEDLEGQYGEDEALLVSNGGALADDSRYFQIEEPEAPRDGQTLRWSRRSTSGSGAFGRYFSWVHGPATPRRFEIRPVLPHVQAAPLRLRDRWLATRRSKCIALTVFYVLWVLSFSLTLYFSVSVPRFAGVDPPVRLSCISRLWWNSTLCGLDGAECRPFGNHSFTFRCPASCMDTKILEPYFVGPTEVNYQSLVIGGQSSLDKDSPIYRADSFICAAALHAGIFSDDTGGCGRLTRVGEQRGYNAGEANGISSISFPSYFPSSFTLGKLDENSTRCRDLRWPLLVVSVIFTSLLSIFTTSSTILFVSTFTGIFVHVALVSDPPDLADYSEVISMAWERFLPASFIGAVIYYFCARPTLRGLTAQLEKTILWLGGCWVGALNNYTFDHIPISRLTPHDIEQQPGAIPALIVIVALLLAIALGQAWAFWREGRLPTYLKLYALMATAILALVAVPNMHLRIHHYILALLLLPGTALQTRPSLLYQGILLGLFINGVARWGFASILQTPVQLLGDAQTNSARPLVTAQEVTVDYIRFNLSEWAEGAAGFSVLVNDVERFRWWKSDGDHNSSFAWKRHVDGLPEYFRFGYIFREVMGNAWYGDFTNPGTWFENGSWVPG